MSLSPAKAIRGIARDRVADTTPVQRTRSTASRAGVACVEFAVTVPILVFVTLAIIDSCNLLHLKQKLNTVAFESARLASLPDSTYESAQSRGMQFAAARGKDVLTYIAEGVGKGSFLMGEQLTLADMQMVYTLEMANMGGALDSYPALQSYRDRLHRQAGLKKAIEVGGPLVPSSWARL